jgi:hypothetical protein
VPAHAATTRRSDDPGDPTLPRRRGWASRVVTGVWALLVLVVLLAGVAASLTHFVDPGIAVPARTADLGAGAVTTVLCGLVAHRIGVNTTAATGCGLVAAAAALVSGWPWLLAGAAVLTAFAATVLGVVATRPAKRALQVVQEYVVAITVALAGAVAVAAYAAPVKTAMLGQVVVLTALVTTLWVAHRLGGGFGGLAERGALVIVSAVVVLAAGMAYGEALRRWGSPDVIAAMDTARQVTVDVLGAVPRPLELFIGFPALVWGLATRSRLQQGWWVCAFGSLGTAGVATSLVGPTVELGQALLSTLYSVLVGLVLGFLVWRLDRLLTGPRGKRARGAERALPPRPEPSRAGPLL